MGVADLFLLRHGRRVGLVDAVRGGEAAAQDLGALGSGPQLLGAAAPRDPSLPAADALHAAGPAQPLLAGKPSPGSIHADVRIIRQMASLCLCGRSSLGSTPRRRPRQAPRENPLARARSMGRLRSRASSIGSWSRSRSRRQCRARGSPRPPARLACPPRGMRPARSPKLPAPPPHRPPSPKRLRRTCLAMTTVATGMRRKGVGCLTRPSRSQRLRPRRRRPQQPRAKPTMVGCLATLRRLLTRVKQTGGCSTTTVASLTRRRRRRRLRLRLRLRKAATVAVCSRTMGGCSMRRPSRLRPKRRRPKPRRRSCHGPSRPTVRKLPNLASRLSWLTARCRLRLLAHRAEKACAGRARAHEAAQGGRSCGSC